MALELNGTTGVSLVQDGVVTAADLASTLDLSSKTVTLPSGTGGKVLQVVQAGPFTNTTTVSANTTASTGISVSITPSSSSSKILVMHQGMINSDALYYWSFFTLYRDSTNLGTGGNNNMLGGILNNSASDHHAPCTIVHLDSPSTTSQVTYTVYMKHGPSGQGRYNADGWYLYITAMEIAG